MLVRERVRATRGRGDRTMSADEFKARAAAMALDLVEDGMRLGLGTGSTAAYFVEGIGGKVAQG
jgi:ribose 5-phosphate isomerase A